MGVRTRGLDIGINAKRQAADAAMRAEAEGVIDRWNEQLAAGRDMLWSPTIRAALIAGTPWLVASPSADRESAEARPRVDTLGRLLHAIVHPPESRIAMAASCLWLRCSVRPINSRRIASACSSCRVMRNSWISSGMWSTSPSIRPPTQSDQLTPSAFASPDCCGDLGTLAFACEASCGVEGRVKDGQGSGGMRARPARAGEKLVDCEPTPWQSCQRLKPPGRARVGVY
jgi:hypothetical protein